MKIILSSIILMVVITCSAQNIVEPKWPSKNENLSTEAYDVFRTNKFLTFKDKDWLIEKINDSIYEKNDLNNYFSYEKDWEEIEKEDTASYQKKEYAKYYHINNTMVEMDIECGGYNVCKEIKTVYNPKCFVLLYEKKYFVGDNYNHTESTINEYDSLNRVIKIINRTKYSEKEPDKESITTIKYEGDTVTITSSENGTMVCELIEDENSVGYISQLSPFETAEYFGYSINQQNFKAVKKYCTDKMIN